LKFGSLAPGWLKAKFEGFHLDVFLIFDILFQDSDWSAANRGDKIRMCPQDRYSAFQKRKLLAKQKRTAALDSLHKFMSSQLRINFTKDMYVIGYYFNFKYFTSQFIGNLMKDFFQPSIHAIHKNLAAIFRTKNNMIFAGV